MEALEGGVLVVGVDGAMRNTAILEILNKVRGEEALADAAFAVDEKVDLFGHKVAPDQRFRGSAMRGPRARGRSAVASDCVAFARGSLGGADGCDIAAGEGNTTGGRWRTGLGAA